MEEYYRLLKHQTGRGIASMCRYTLQRPLEERRRNQERANAEGGQE